MTPVQNTTARGFVGARAVDRTEEGVRLDRIAPRPEGGSGNMKRLVEACARLVQCGHEGAVVVSFGAHWCPACGAFEQQGAGGWFRPELGRELRAALGPSALSPDARALYWRVRAHGPYRMTLAVLYAAYGSAPLVELAQAELFQVDDEGRVAMVGDASESGLHPVAVAR